MPIRTTFRKLGILLLCQLSVGAAVFAAPTTLFHWTSDRGLNRWASHMEAEGEFVLKPLDPGSAFAQVYTQFKGEPGLFTWINPITGIGGIGNGNAEWYAREDKNEPQKPARLVLIEIKPDAVVEELETIVDYRPPLPELLSKDPRSDQVQPGQGIGLIFHKVKDQTGKLVFQEYILLKRGAVAFLTADPQIVHPLLEQELLRFESGAKYHDAELHFIEEDLEESIFSEHYRKTIGKKVRRTLAQPSGIPQIFMAMGKSCIGVL